MARAAGSFDVAIRLAHLASIRARTALGGLAGISRTASRSSPMLSARPRRYFIRPRCSSITAARAGSPLGPISFSAAVANAMPCSSSPAAGAASAADSRTSRWLAPMRFAASGSAGHSSRILASMASLSAWARARLAAAAACQALSSAWAESCAAYQWCACSITARPGATKDGSAARISARRLCSRVFSPGSTSPRIASRIRACRNAYPSPSGTSTFADTADRRATSSESSPSPVTAASSGCPLRCPATPSALSTSCVSAGRRHTSARIRSRSDSGNPG